MFSQQLMSKFANAESVVVFTGAGISAESGVATFRGNNGIWKQFKPEELANFDAFMKNPDIVWAWYVHRRRMIAEIQPNPGHYAIAKMEHHHRCVTVVTQNIDGLHQRAGSTTVYELHGNINKNYCTGCGRYFSNDNLLNKERVPRCLSCNGFIRPDVVWFGEMLPEDAWNASVAAAKRADIFFVVGTSAVVYPAASLPTIARRAGAYVVEVNIEPTEISSRVDESLIGKSGNILPQLLASCYPEKIEY